MQDTIIVKIGRTDTGPSIALVGNIHNIRFLNEIVCQFDPSLLGKADCDKLDRLKLDLKRARAAVASLI